MLPQVWPFAECPESETQVAGADRHQPPCSIGVAPFRYAYFTPSQGSANRSASGGVLGAMARPASANPGTYSPSLHISLRLLTLIPLINTPNIR